MGKLMEGSTALSLVAVLIASLSLGKVSQLARIQGPLAPNSTERSVPAGDTVLPDTYYEYSLSVLDRVALFPTVQHVTTEDLLAWDDRMFALIEKQRLPPTAASRIYAYVLTGQHDFVRLSEYLRGEEQGSIGIVTAELLCLFFPEECADLQEGLPTDPYSNALASAVAGQAKLRIIEENALKKPYARKDDPTLWFGENPVTPDAGSWKTWLIGSASKFRAPQPPAFDSAEDRAEVEAVVDALAQLTDDQHEKVLFWAGGPGTATPAGIWLKITDGYIAGNRIDLSNALDVRATLAMGLADAFIVCWDTKFTYWTQRPFMRDPRIATVIPTPNFPSYTSGHSAVSAAAATILTHYFPTEGSEWMRMAEEARDTRLWSGIHFPIDNERGFEMGVKVAEKVLGRL
ncbi:MAG: vanadium-dependent haloperoxidase [Candidatus Peregrinibacteria bacterium]|nr:vanadium-dependent haloperoxidase [Candidatus Peregrinibacteria bacterium]